MSIYRRKVHVYETDLMGIVHHSNYVRFCEEARVDWLIQKGILDLSPSTVYLLTVIDIRFKYIKPLRYREEFSIQLQIKAVGVKLVIQYKIFNSANVLCALAETVHCSINEAFKVLRLDQKMLQKISSHQKESPWTETWL